jgi:hypothetical protein
MYYQLGADNRLEQQSKAAKERIKKLGELLQKINVDRFALYLGILFTPDQPLDRVYLERKAEADARALKLKEALDKVLVREFASMQPSAGAKFKALLPFTKTIEEIQPVPDKEYAVKVGSLVYAHLSGVAARESSSRFVSSQLPGKVPAVAAAWVELARGSAPIGPKQFHALMGGYIEGMYPEDEAARLAVVEEFCAEVARLRALPAHAPYLALGATTAQEVERLYFPFRA